MAEHTNSISGQIRCICTYACAIPGWTFVHWARNFGCDRNGRDKDSVTSRPRRPAPPRACPSRVLLPRFLPSSNFQEPVKWSEEVGGTGTQAIRDDRKRPPQIQCCLLPGDDLSITVADTRLCPHFSTISGFFRPSGVIVNELKRPSGQKWAVDNVFS